MELIFYHFTFTLPVNLFLLGLLILLHILNNSSYFHPSCKLYPDFPHISFSKYRMSFNSELGEYASSIAHTFVWHLKRDEKGFSLALGSLESH